VINLKIRTWLIYGLPFLIFFTSFFVAIFGMVLSSKATTLWTELLLDKTYESITDKIKYEQERAMIIVDTILYDESIVEAFAEKNRELLIQLIMRYHTFYNINYDLFQIHFHTPDLKSFLRTSDITKFGDDVSSYRPDIKYVAENKVPTFSTGVGAKGAMLRYIAPVFYEGEYVGSVEANINVGTSFAKKLSGDALIKVFFNEKKERIDALYKSREEVDDFTNVFDENEILTGQFQAFVKDGYVYIAIPIFDFEKNVYACVYQRENISNIVNIVKAISTVQILGSLIISIFLAYLGVRIGKKLRERISKVRSAIESL